MKDFWVFIVLTLIIWFCLQLDVSEDFSEAFPIIEEFLHD